MVELGPIINGNQYEIAPEEHFVYNEAAGQWRYVGPAEYVDISRFGTERSRAGLFKFNKVVKGVAGPRPSTYGEYNEFTGERERTWDYSEMFYGIESDTIDLTGLTFGYVQDVTKMFAFSNVSKVIGMHDFATSNLDYMFEGSRASVLDLTELGSPNSRGEPYSPWSVKGMLKTSKVSKVVGLDFWDTSNFSEMFMGNRAPLIDAGPIDATDRNSVNMSKMFKGAHAKTILTGQMNTVNVRNMSEMFMYTNTEELDLRNFDTGSVRDFSGMFEGAEAQTILLSSFNTRWAEDMSRMFKDTKARHLSLLNFDTSYSGLRDMSYMFDGAQATKLDLRNFGKHGSHRNLKGMFRNTAATEIILTGFNLLSESSSTNADPTAQDYMFEGAAITELDLSASSFRLESWNINNLEMNDFIKDSNITKIYVAKESDVKELNKRLNLGLFGTGWFSGVDVVVGGAGYTAPNPIPFVVEEIETDILEVIREPKQTTTIPFETERVINREMRDGQEKIKQEGKDGWTTTQYEVTKYKDGTEERKLILNTTQAPINEIIEYGTLVRTFTETEEEVTEHDTIEYNSYTMNAPQRRVEQRGADGIVRKTITVKEHSDGYEEREEDVRKRVTRPAITEIVAVGMIERKTTLTEEEEIPFEVKRTYDYNRLYNDGEPRIIERGRVGSIRRTYEVTIYVDGTPSLKIEHPEKRTRREPQTQLESIGLIDYIAKETERKEIEFEVAYEYTDDLLEGEERLKQQGVNGFEERTFDVIKYITHPETGRKRDDKKEEIREDYKYQKPVTHIIEKGTKDPIKSIEEEFVVKTVRFETDYVDDDTMYEGQEYVARAGVDGRTEEKWQIITYHDGTVQRHLVYVHTDPTIGEIIHRGTKDPIIRTETTTETEAIEFETVYIPTNSIPVDEERIFRQGVEGLTVRTYELVIRYDDEKTVNMINTETTPPVNQLVLLGVSRKINEERRDVVTQIAPYETFKEFDENLYEGEEIIDTVGKDGVTEYVYMIIVYEDGEVEEILIDEIVTEPINQVVRVGIKKDTSDEELRNLTNLGMKTTGEWLILEDGDKTIRSTTHAKIRPIWAYL